jgi:serine/threonine protein kinase
MIALAGITIYSKIGESSASLVYRGIRDADRQAIVVKLLKLDYPSLQEFSQQDYQHTLAILLEDFGEGSIERWMRHCPKSFSPVSLTRFFRLAIDVTEILGSIHNADIIHKDINPGNILLTGYLPFPTIDVLERVQ